MKYVHRIFVFPTDLFIHVSSLNVVNSASANIKTKNQAKEIWATQSLNYVTSEVV